MIVNMPATPSGHSPNPFPATSATTNCHDGSSPTHCEYNFLKRKFDGECDLSDCNANVGVSESSNAEYQNSTACTTPAWKKRHLQETTSDTTDPNVCYNNNATNNYNIYSQHTHNETQLLIGAIQTDENVQNEICVSTSASNATNNNCTTINNNNNNDKTNNNNNNNNSNMTFNLISGSSSFINDLFAYDANLIVPVTASLVSQPTNDSADSTLPTFVTPSNVCVNTNYDDGSNWQATDLLELDHRYNSGLQTEIAHLHPTVALKAAEENTLSVVQQSQKHPHPLQQQQQMEASNQTQFLIPEKQVSSPNGNTGLSRYRPLSTGSQLLQMQPCQQSTLAQSNTLTDTEADFEDRNLSWLLNFKFDEFPHLSPDLGGNSNNNSHTNTLNNGLHNRNSCSPTSSHKSNSCSPQSSTPHSGTQQNVSDYMRSPKGTTKAGKKFEELVMEVTAEVDGNDIMVAENVIIENSPQRTPKKPPFTYTELIEYALEDKGELTVSGIYQWISDRFPYYKSNDDRWKNSVRHNLSINPHFRKGLKAPQGAGHLWTISSGDSAENVLAWEHKKQRLDLFFKMESMNRERLQQHQQQMQQRQSCTSPHPDCQQHQQGKQQQQQQACVYDEAATAAATIAREMLSNSCDEGCARNSNNSSDSNNQRLESNHLVHELPFNDLMSDEELRKTAGQILNGIHREVEVQSVNSIISTYHDVLLDNEDYLNPIHKDVAVHESGLRSTNATHLASSSYIHSHNTANSQYYVTEIDPLELGIQMSHQVGAEEVLFNDEFNLNYFGYNGANDIAA
ncbi:transcription factor mef2A isoform X1 [Bactrocera tryoni]|uniref:transcription factor mef2A isoform X1 n=1 Tax=Bactrocera tryoni TaxID=59916 RepID=UPI001A98E8D6|nr:transcription factor mef2A isoform X1 [Bactrocera tryoni]